MVNVANTPEHTDEQADNPSPSSIEVASIEVEGYRPMITFRIRSGRNWNDSDLVINKITRLAVTERRDYITVFRERLRQRRLATGTDAVAVGALGFCVAPSDEPLS